jgi:hypothetical protein
VPQTAPQMHHTVRNGAKPARLGFDDSGTKAFVTKEFMAETDETSAISEPGPSFQQTDQVFLASILLKARQRNSPPLPHAYLSDARSRQVVMRELRRILVAGLIGMTISVGAFAQKGGNDNRPPKEQPRVVDKEKEKPPPNNNQSNSNKPRKP